MNRIGGILSDLVAGFMALAIEGETGKARAHRLVELHAAAEALVAKIEALQKEDT